MEADLAERGGIDVRGRERRLGQLLAGACDVVVIGRAIDGSHRRTAAGTPCPAAGAAAGGRIDAGTASSSAATTDEPRDEQERVKTMRAPLAVHVPPPFHKQAGPVSPVPSDELSCEPRAALPR